MMNYELNDQIEMHCDEGVFTFSKTDLDHLADGAELLRKSGQWTAAERLDYIANHIRLSLTPLEHLTPDMLHEPQTP